MDRIVSGSENKQAVVSLPIVEHPHVQIAGHHGLMFHNPNGGLSHNFVPSGRIAKITRLWHNGVPKLPITTFSEIGISCDDSGDLAEIHKLPLSPIPTLGDLPIVEVTPRLETLPLRAYAISADSDKWKSANSGNLAKSCKPWIIARFSETGKSCNDHTTGRVHLPHKLALALLDDAGVLTYEGWVHFHKPLAIRVLRNAVLRTLLHLAGYVNYILPHVCGGMYFYTRLSFGTSANVIHTLALECVQNSLYFQSQHYTELPYSLKAGIIGNFGISGNLAKTTKPWVITHFSDSGIMGNGAELNESQIVRIISNLRDAKRDAMQISETPPIYNVWNYAGCDPRFFGKVARKVISREILAIGISRIIGKWQAGPTDNCCSPYEWAINNYRFLTNNPIARVTHNDFLIFGKFAKIQEVDTHAIANVGVSLRSFPRLPFYVIYVVCHVCDSMYFSPTFSYECWGEYVIGLTTGVLQVLCKFRSYSLHKSVKTLAMAFLRILAESHRGIVARIVATSNNSITNLSNNGNNYGRNCRPCHDWNCRPFSVLVRNPEARLVNNSVYLHLWDYTEVPYSLIGGTIGNKTPARRSAGLLTLLRHPKRQGTERIEATPSYDIEGYSVLHYVVWNGISAGRSAALHTMSRLAEYATCILRHVCDGMQLSEPPLRRLWT
jgi:hypothetical protein